MIAGDALDVDALGLRVRIELGAGLDGAQRRRVRQAWSGALSTGDGDPDLTVPFPAGADHDRAMERLTVDVTLAALEALRGRALMFHAAGVADERGTVAAFVGPSGRGKTTLSRELGRQWGYVSDETIAVQPDLRVSPYRKPLSVVRPGAPKRQVPAQEAGLKDLPAAALRLGALVLIERDAGLAAPEVTSIPLAEALPQLVPQMSYLRFLDRPLQAVASLADAVGGIRLLRYPDAGTVPALLPQLLTSQTHASGWSPAPEPVPDAPLIADGTADAILTDGFLIVMVGATLHVLDGIAPQVWLSCARGEDIDGIVAGVLAEYGPPPQGDAAALVRSALEELIEAGVLRRR
ncbi:hypothetical protein [Microbacterium soli]|uniref:Coenzyme PQQ synthesis protein D (PqqD) n=1 Tax=Microbacterium soli TaxID=446075 RepID=A0ABP7MWM0_9MICO